MKFLNKCFQFGSLTGGSRQINTNTSSSAATGAAAPTAGNTGAAQAQTDAKSNLDKYSGELKQQTQARDKADDQLASLNEDYKGVCEDVKSKEKSKSSAQDKVTSAKQSVAQSEAAVKSAEQSVQRA